MGRTPSNQRYRAVDYGKGPLETLSDERERGQSISDWEMKQFLLHMRAWIVANAQEANGLAYSGKRIESMLGVKAPEISNWHNDKARPGIARLLHLKEKWGLRAVDELLGYDVETDADRVNELVAQFFKQVTEEQVRPRARGKAAKTMEDIRAFGNKAKNRKRAEKLEAAERELKAPASRRTKTG